MAVPDVCLGIAIDHRIRQLFKSAPKPEVKPYSNHAQKLRQLHPFVRSRADDPSHENLVTEQLARPHHQGGLLVALQRPADNHPFPDGVDNVVEESPTLRALKDVFALTGLDLVDQITVVDSLPFLRLADKRRLGNDPEAYLLVREEHHAIFLEAVVAKRPDVVLCMWQRERDPLGDWPGHGIESLGVGQLFEDAKVTLRDRLGNSIETQRVNIFHPGYCMNWNPEYSRFRQLLMLEIAQACHLLDRTWQGEPWMAELRDDCIRMARELAGSKPELHVIYANAMTQIQDTVSDLASGGYPWDQMNKVLYNKLITSKWTGRLNDAALCLRAVQRWQTDSVGIHDSTGASGDMAIRTMGLVMCLTMKLRDPVKMGLRSHPGEGLFSEQFVKNLQEARKQARASWFRNRTLKKSIIDFLLGLNNAFSDSQDIQGPFRLQMSLVSASDAFLTMAQNMEGLLGTLAGYSEKEEAVEAKTEGDVGLDSAEVQTEAAMETRLSEEALSEAMRKLEALKLS